MNNKKLIQQLYKKPPKEVDFPSIPVNAPNMFHEFDILHFTNDNGYQYILSVIDVYNSKMDARPLKSKSMTPIIDALDQIYDNGQYLNRPRTLQGDHAFNNKALRDWCQRHQINLKITEVNEHRQNAHVERLNQTIGTILWKLQVDVEITTKRPYTQWVNWLPQIVKEINDTKPAIVPDKVPLNQPLKLNKVNRYFFENGDKVRLSLSHPQTIQGKPLHGNFRATDHRWSYPDEYQVVDLYLMPDQPPLYRIKNIKTDKLFNHLVPAERLQLI